MSSVLATAGARPLKPSGGRVSFLPGRGGYAFAAAYACAAIARR